MCRRGVCGIARPQMARENHLLANPGFSFPPYLGTVQVAGYSSRAGGFGPRPAGCVTHMPLLYGELSAEENLQFYGRLYGIMELNRRVQEVLGLVGLTLRRRDLVARFHAACSSALPSARHTTRSGSGTVR